MSSVHYTLADPVYGRYRNMDSYYRDVSRASAACSTNIPGCSSQCAGFKNSPCTYQTCCNQHKTSAPASKPVLQSRSNVLKDTQKQRDSSSKSSGSKSSKKDPCAKNCSSFKSSDPNQCKTCCVGNGGDQSTCDTCCGTTSTTDTGTTDTGTTDTGTTDTSGDTTTTTTDSGPVGGIFERMYQSVCCGGSSSSAGAAYAYPAYTYNVGEQGYLDNWENYDPSDYGDTNYYDYGYPYDNSETYFAYASKKKTSSSSSKKSSSKSSKSSGTDTSGGTTDSSGGSTDTSGGGGGSNSTDTSSAPAPSGGGGGGSCSGGIPFMCDDQGKFTMVIVLGLVFLIALSMKR